MSSINTKVYGPVNMNFKNLFCSCLCMLEDVWMKEQNCVISVLCGDKKRKEEKEKSKTCCFTYFTLFHLIQVIRKAICFHSSCFAPEQSWSSSQFSSALKS